MYLFYLLIFVLPLEEHWFWRKELFGSFTMIKALGVGCFLAALCRIILFKADPQLLRSSVARLYVAFVAVQCGSYFFHGGKRDVDLVMYWHVASIVMLWLMVSTLVDSSTALFRTLLVSICGIAFASLYTIRGQQLGGGGDVRPSGIFADANYYALVVGLWLPLAYLWIFHQRKTWLRILCAGCFAAMLLGCLFAASRGGALGLGAALLFLIWHSSHRLRNLLVLGAVITPLLFYTNSSLLRRFLHPGYGDTQAENARLVVWKASLSMVRAHPFAGVGLGNFERVVHEYEDPDEQVVTVAHNTYIESAAELGIPGLAVHLALLGAAFLTLGRVRRRARALKMNQFYIVALGLQAGLLSYFVSAFFVSTWWQNIVWLCIFLSIAVERISRRAELARVREKTKMSEEAVFAHS